ncbi:MAG: hypothetical protein QXY91_04515 [Thermoproteota archaeon]
MKRTVLLIDGPFCYSCIKLLVDKMKTLDGITDVKLNVLAGLLILYSKDSLNIMEVQKTIEATGFRFLRKIEN